MAGASYTIKKNRICKGWYPGFSLGEDGVLRSLKGESSHRLYLRAIDSATEDSEWGRLSLKGEFTENTVFYVYAIARNTDTFHSEGLETKMEDFLCSKEVSHGKKKEFFASAGALRRVNCKDMLLYELKGRYLYLMLEVMGEGECSIQSLKVDLTGDNFMTALPESYHERNGFLHRFLSVFSSVYQDFEEEIEKLPQVLDLDTCPASMLPVYAKWLGLDVGELRLEESILRSLVKEAYQLNRKKGTKAALERISQIVLGEDVLVLERNMMQKYVGKEQMEEFERFYGNSKHDVTILCKNVISEAQKTRLLYLLNRYKPIRTQLHIIRLKREGTLDDYSYLDMNARISMEGNRGLDGTAEMDGAVCLL